MPLLTLILVGADGTRLRTREASRSSDASSWLSSWTVQGGHHCFALQAGETATVRSVKLRHRNASYLVASPSVEPLPTGRRALDSTLEVLLGNCDRRTTMGRDWVIDAGAQGGEVSALAASAGCSVAALDYDRRSVAYLEATACINHDAPYVVFQGVAAEKTGRQKLLSAAHAQNAAKDESGLAEGIALDDLFMKGNAASLAAGGVQVPNRTGIDWGAEVALLKVTQRDCCNMASSTWALHGAKELIKSGRVRCVMAEVDFDKASMGSFLEALHDLERQGYRLAHAGPLDSPEIEIMADGTYPFFDTSSKQLGEIYDELEKIRRFDERSGYRAYSKGLSLDRNGRYFDYSEFVLACRGQFPDRLTVREEAKIRYSKGMWWPQTKKKAI